MKPRETVITSPDNAVFKLLRDTLSSKGIKKHGLFLVFGERVVRETLENQPGLVRNIITGPDYGIELLSSERKLLNEAQKAAPQATHLILAKPLFSELDLFGTKSMMLALEAPELPVVNLLAPPQGLELVCALGDPSNLGALLRSAAAFSASRVILLRESASPFHPKAVRAASAATATMLTRLARGPAMADIAGPMIALNMDGAPIANFAWPQNVRILLGEEGQGVPKDSEPQGSSFRLVSIPMASGVESLNATVAASIALFSYRSQHVLKGQLKN